MLFILSFKLITVNMIIAFKRAGRNRVFLQAVLLKDANSLECRVPRAVSSNELQIIEPVSVSSHLRRRTHKLTLRSRIGKSRIYTAGRKPLDSNECEEEEEERGGKILLIQVDGQKLRISLYLNNVKTLQKVRRQN